MDPADTLASDPSRANDFFASPPVALTVAGSDNSAGAGIQADLKTFGAFGVYGLTAVTCVVAEVPGAVEAVQPIDPAIVRAQIRLSLDHFPVRAAKTGMLYSAEIIRETAAALGDAGLPVVVDPVMVATSGDPLLQPDAVAAYRELLFPLAAVVTPNLDEAAVLLGGEIRSLDAMREAGRELAGRFGVPFLLKGGHLRGERAVDCLVAGGEIEEFEGPFFPGISTHGTGCTFSAAIAAGLAKGEPLREAVAAGKRFVAGAIARALRWGSVDALDHLGLGR